MMNKVTRKKEKEIILIDQMISLYEKGNQKDLTELKHYSHERINKCPRITEKTFCSACHIHCYDKHHRQLIKTVMKYSGKRMLFIHPLTTFHHGFVTIKQILRSKLK